MSIIYQLLHGLVKWWSLVKCVSTVNPEDGFEFSDELLLWAGQRANTRIAIQSGTWWVGIDGVPYQLVVTLTACYHVEICWSLNRINRIVLYCAHRLYISLIVLCRFKCCDGVDIFHYMGFAPTATRICRSPVDWAQLVNRVETKGENKARKWRSCIKLPVAMLLLCIFLSSNWTFGMYTAGSADSHLQISCHFILVSQ